MPFVLACAGLVNDGMVGNDADLPSTQGFVEQLTTSVRVHPPVDLKQGLCSLVLRMSSRSIEPHLYRNQPNLVSACHHDSR